MTQGQRPSGRSPRSKSGGAAEGGAGSLAGGGIFDRSRAGEGRRGRHKRVLRGKAGSSFSGLSTHGKRRNATTRRAATMRAAILTSHGRGDEICFEFCLCSGDGVPDGRLQSISEEFVGSGDCNSASTSPIVPITERGKAQPSPYNIANAPGLLSPAIIQYTSETPMFNDIIW